MKTSQPATSGARILHPTEFFHSGVTAFFALQSDQRFSYCLYVPTAHQQATEPLPLVVVVHGTNRLAERYRTHFRDFAEEHGCIVLAPLFPAGVADPEDLHGYKRLLHQGIRYDTVLLDIVEQIGSRYTVDTARFLLHGFSGGGQFAHRFAYLHPERLTALSVGAPGRITRINPEAPWWLGTADVAERFGREIDLGVLRTVPVQMLVGDADTDTWEIAEPGLDVGGDTRIERMLALRDNWEQHGIRVRFDLIPGMGHSGSAALPHVQRFFAGILEPSGAGRSA
ncbi:PHB depolymerase family esterase [Streptomyces sp. NPDC003328]|uniref:PHB depolymerase family esterase n=1 Tax=unclassified Streptomyces TaxID=2593676 RepID=UPI000B072BA5|nr:PHB depolymerase family esterase [Streptomyces sp. NRRL F-5122]